MVRRKQFSGVGDDNLYDHVEGFQDKFADVVKEYVGEEGRLVVFIDDLDRCLPEGAITVLESLKLFLDRSQCVFVIGVDQAALTEAIKTAIRTVSQTATKATSRESRPPGPW